MPRNSVARALTLRVRHQVMPSGETNREAWFLSAEAGLIKATVFGGPKSRLRSHTSPFHSGQLWLYGDPRRDSLKVTDFDVLAWRPGLRELYERTMAADALAETILATQGGGAPFKPALDLAEGVLDALDSAEGSLCSRLLIYFLWRWADVLGAKPELTRCGACGAALGNGDSLLFAGEELLCPRCAPLGSSTGEEGRFPVGPGARRWLLAVEALGPGDIARYTLDEASRLQAKALASGVLSGLTGKRLSTWDLV